MNCQPCTIPASDAHDAATLPAAAPPSARPRCCGRESKFLAAARTSSASNSSRCAPRCSPSAKSSTSRWAARPSRLPGQRMVAKAAETAPIAIERHTQIVLLTNELIFVNRSQRNAGNPARSSAQFGRIKIMPANDHRSRVEHATRVLFPATRRERFAACDQTRKIINLCGRRSSADSALCPSSFPEIHPHSSSRLCAFA